MCSRRTNMHIITAHGGGIRSSRSSRSSLAIYSKLEDNLGYDIHPWPKWACRWLKDKTHATIFWLAFLKYWKSHFRTCYLFQKNTYSDNYQISWLQKTKRACNTSSLYLSLEERTCLSVVVRGSQGNTENLSHFTVGFPVKEQQNLTIKYDGV